MWKINETLIQIFRQKGWNISKQKHLFFWCNQDSGHEKYKRVVLVQLVYILGWTLFQKMFGGHNSMSRSTFESHNDKAKQWNYFLLAIKWLQIRCTYIAILIYHNLVTFLIQWHFVIITVYNVDKSGNFVVFF